MSYKRKISSSIPAKTQHFSHGENGKYLLANNGKQPQVAVPSKNVTDSTVQNHR